MKKPSIGIMVSATALAGHKVHGFCIGTTEEFIEVLSIEGETIDCRAATVTSLERPKREVKQISKALSYVLQMSTDLRHGRLPSGEFQFLPTLESDADEKAPGILIAGDWGKLSEVPGTRDQMSSRLVLRQVNDQFGCPELHVVVQYAQFNKKLGSESQIRFAPGATIFDPRESKAAINAIAYFVKQEHEMKRCA